MICGLMCFFLNLVPIQGLTTCMACFQLRGVEIILDDGRIVKGYIAWNDEWVTVFTNTKKKFPDIIFLREDRDVVSVYTHLRTIKFPIKGIVATKDPMVIRIPEIKRLVAKPGAFEGMAGATRLPLVSERIARLLQMPPEGYCTYDASVADVYWVSYNKNITKAQIDCLCEKQAEEVTDCGISSHTADVFDLHFFYD